MQQLEKARDEADLALAVDPDDVKARHLAARISLTLTDLPRAEADLEVALKQAPDDADIKTTHAIICKRRTPAFSLCANSKPSFANTPIICTRASRRRCFA